MQQIVSTTRKRAKQNRSLGSKGPAKEKEPEQDRPTVGYIMREQCLQKAIESNYHAMHHLDPTVAISHFM